MERYEAVLLATLLILASHGCSSSQPARSLDPLDRSPVCHYLDRGIDDFVPGEVDRYVITLEPDEVRTLDQVDHVEFGFDLPITHCKDNPRSTPCADKDLSLEACIDHLSLSLGTIRLFEETAAQGDCLVHPSSGLGGRRRIYGDDLRGNPQWGLTPDELEVLLAAVDVQEDGGFRPALPGIRLPAPFLANLLETRIGQDLGRRTKGKANADYHANRRGLIVRWSGNRAACAHGDCPPRDARRSSPWLEIFRLGPRTLGVDLELDLFNGTYDPGDCVEERDGGLRSWNCGTLYTRLTDVRIETAMELQCQETGVGTWVEEDEPLPFEPGRIGARVPRTPPPLVRLPYCRGPAERPCLRPLGGIAGIRSRVDCPPEPEDEDAKPKIDRTHCGRLFEPVASRWDLALVFGEDPQVEVEGRFLAGFLRVFCPDCDFDSAVAKVLGAQDRSLYRDLDGCPPVSISETGDVSIDLTNLESCPPGGHDPGCDRLTLGFSSRRSAGNRDLVSPDVSPDGSGLDSVPQAPAPLPPELRRRHRVGAATVADLALATGALRQRDLVAALTRQLSQPPAPDGPHFTDPYTRDLARSMARTLGQYWSVSQPSTEKIPMERLDDAIVALCAANKHCAPELDLESLPLAELAKTDWDAVDDILDEPCQTVSCQQQKVTRLEEEVGSLVRNDSFRRHCVYVGREAPPPPQTDLERLAYLVELASWYEDRFQREFRGVLPWNDPDYETARRTLCRYQAPRLEELIPVPYLTLDLSVAEPVDDNFLFVNFRDNDRVGVRARAALGCYHLRDHTQPPSKAPRCGLDGHIIPGLNPDHRYEGVGERCGTVAGGPCIDIGAPWYRDWEIFPSDLYDPRLQPNGDFSFHTRCEPDAATGLPMVCNAVGFPGEGAATGVCQICGTPGGAGDSPHLTQVGCEPVGLCDFGSQLGTDGRCWRDDQGIPEWMCEIDCTEFFGRFGFCIPGKRWRELVYDLFAFPDAVDPEATDYDRPICVDWGCEDHGQRCAAKAMTCRSDVGCIRECNEHDDCQRDDPFPPYPGGFLCSPAGTCRTDVTVGPKI